MDMDIEKAFDIDLERLKIQTIRDNTAVLADIAISLRNLSRIWGALEEINDSIVGELNETGGA